MHRQTPIAGRQDTPAGAIVREGHAALWRPLAGCRRSPAQAEATCRRMCQAPDLEAAADGGGAPRPRPKRVPQVCPVALLGGHHSHHHPVLLAACTAHMAGPLPPPAGVQLKGWVLLLWFYGLLPVMQAAAARSEVDGRCLALAAGPAALQSQKLVSAGEQQPRPGIC